MVEDALLQRSTLTSQFDLTNIALVKAYGVQLLLRLQLPFLALLVQVPLLGAAFFQRGHSAKTTQPIRRRTFIYVAVLLLVTGFLYWNTPYTAQISDGKMSPLVGYNLRYGFPALGVLGVAAAVSTTALQVPKRLVVGGSLLSSFSGTLSSLVFDAVKNQTFIGDRIIWGGQIISNFQTAPLQAMSLTLRLLSAHSSSIVAYIAIYVGLMALACSILPSDRLRVRVLTQIRRGFRPANRWLTGGICIVLIVSLSWTMRQSREANRDLFYRGIYSYIEENTQPGDAIAYFDSDRNYLFYGKHLDRQVLHIPFQLEQPESWLEHLRQTEAAFLGTGPQLRNKVRDAITKLNQPEAALVPAFGDDVAQESVLYRVVPQ